jgi:predicted glutamine amidotransferase
VLAYLGSPVLLDHLLYQPDSSLLKQAIRPRMLEMLNLAGFGLTAWDPESHEPAIPFQYSTTIVPVFDANLRHLSRKLRPSCVVAHVRGVQYNDRVHVNHENLHPFSFEGTPVTLAHNGDLAQFERFKWELARHVRPEIRAKIRGSTDSEWIYALVLSMLENPGTVQRPLDLVRAVDDALRIIYRTREEVGVSQSSSVNLFVSDGHSIVATRFTYDFGCYENSITPSSLEYLSQWFTIGRDYGFHDGEWKMVGGVREADSVIIASEPLTVDTSTWLQVPEYSAICATRDGDRTVIQTVALAS